MVIGIASDHAGFDMKEKAIAYLKTKGFEVKDYGTNSNESSDYADFAHLLANAIESQELKLGVAFCGSGNGINIALNRHAHVRSAYCWKPIIAALARQHNDANICTMPARFLEPEEVYKIIDAFFEAEFEGGRHQRRIDKIEINNK